MAMKQKTVFVCSECGTETPKWNGKCPGCGAWNTLEEASFVSSPSKNLHGGVSFASASEPPKNLSEISITEDERILTGFSEFDRVLGGGIIPGSLVLLGGDPGIGKSTLLLQICEHLGKTKKIFGIFGKTTYISIEVIEECT